MTFGEAVDVLRRGDAVQRVNWKPLETFGRQPFIRLVPEVESDTGDRVEYAHFVIILEGLDTTYQQVWSPAHEDLLASDWEVR